MVIFGNIVRQNLIKTYTKMHQIALFFLHFHMGACPQKYVKNVHFSEY